MNILHVITGLDRGGAETQLLTLVRLQIGEHSVSVFSIRKNGQLESEFQRLGIKLFHPSSSRLIGVFRGLRKTLNAGFFDILHAHLPRAEILSRLAIFNLKISFVVTRHNYERFIPNVPKVFRVLSTIVSRWVTKRACSVIAISNAVNHFLMSTKEVSASCRLVTIYYGFDQSFNPEIIPDKTASQERFVIGTISRLVDQKRIDVLLKAFSELNMQSKLFSLEIVGSGKRGVCLRELAKDLGVEKSVSWIPNTENRISHLRNFDVFVLTSEYEGFGLVLLEAMQLGKPIIASSNTAIVEVLGEHYIGLFPTGDSISLAKKIRFFSLLPKLERYQIQNYLVDRAKLFSPLDMHSNIMREYENCRKVSNLY